MTATEVSVGASSAATDMVVTVVTADMEVAMGVGVEAIMVALEEARARVQARVSPAVQGTVAVTATLAH
jgi:hypothetical protein